MSAKKRGPYVGSEQRREAILDAAFVVFSQRGYAGGSLQKIADEVGMSQTALLHYFHRKSDLLLAVLRKRDAIGSAGLPEGNDELIAGVLRQVRINESVPGLVELYTVLTGEAMTEGNPGRGYLERRFAELREEYRRRFQLLAKEDRLRPGVTPEGAAVSLIALWDGLQIQWLLDPDHIDIAAQLEAYLLGIITDAGGPQGPVA